MFFVANKQKQKYFAIAIIAAIIIAAMFLDYRTTVKSRLTLYQQIGDLAYQGLVKPQDQTPLPPAEIKKGSVLDVPILMYHHIGTPPAGADKIQIGLTVSTDNFEAQAKWLKEQGYQSVSLSDIYAAAKKQPVRWPAKPVMFTFDDGYTDAFINAVPILKQYGFTGAFGIITQFPGTTGGTNSYATWQQIANAKQEGMEIVCHTQNHFDGGDPKYSSNYIYENLTGCQQDITGHLGSTEPYLIYPYGHYSPIYLDQTKKAGFVMAMTVHEGRQIILDDLMRLPRLRVNGGMSLDAFVKMVEK